MALHGQIASKFPYVAGAGGRLSLSATEAYPLGNINNANTLYYHPYVHDIIALYDGTKWVLRQFGILSLSLTGLLANTNYDIFIRWNNGFQFATNAWTNNSTRSVALAKQNGVYVASNNLQFRYLGTIRTAAAGLSSDNEQYRFIWNVENKETRTLSLGDTGTNAGAIYLNEQIFVWRPVRNANPNLNIISVVSGLNTDIQLKTTWATQSAGGAGAYHQGQPYINGAAIMAPVATVSPSGYASCVPLLLHTLGAGLFNLEPYEAAWSNPVYAAYQGMQGNIRA